MPQKKVGEKFGEVNFRRIFGSSTNKQNPVLMNTNLTSHLNEDLAFSVNRSIELIAEATDNNHHTLARLHATRPFMKTSSENFLKGHQWQSELADIDRCHRSMGCMTEALLNRRDDVTNEILNATSAILGQAIAEAMWAEM